MNSEQLKQLKTKAHNLNPVVIIGQSGLTEAVIAEVELALNHHELIKIKIRAERDDRKTISEQIFKLTSAVKIQAIGQVLVIYRKNPALP
jgi:RNA-binding protein